MNSDETVNYGLTVAITAIVFLALAGLATADTGAYNYGVSILNASSNYPIGADMKINAYVSYNNLSVREYPCILTFYDYLDNNTLFSERIYTDELGQILYTAKVGDMFSNNQNYTYSIQCSNTTSQGKILITTNTRHTFISNVLVWLRLNINYLLIVGAVLFLTLLIFSAKTLSDRRG